MTQVGFIYNFFAKKLFAFTIDRIWLRPLKHGICGFFFSLALNLLLSGCHKKSSNDNSSHSKWVLREQWIGFSENFIVLNKKRFYLKTFWWRLESQRSRAREKRNHKFLALLFLTLQYIIESPTVTMVQSNMTIRNGLIRNKLVCLFVLFTSS